MAGIFEDIQFQKTDLNTVKELKEDCWRKAQGEDLEAFLGFYLKKKPARSWQIAAWAALFVFLISAGELGFERLCKNDPSYNPVPMTIGVIVPRLCSLREHKKSAAGTAKSCLTARPNSIESQIFPAMALM